MALSAGEGEPAGLDGGNGLENRDSARLSPAEGRKFGLTVGLAFWALGGVLWWRGHATPAAVVAALGVPLVLGGLLVPDRLGPIQRAWMLLALAISRVTTPILMSLVYFLVLTPTGLLMRLLGRNPIRHVGEESVWRRRENDERRSDLDHQF